MLSICVFFFHILIACGHCFYKNFIYIYSKGIAKETEAKAQRRREERKEEREEGREDRRGEVGEGGREEKREGSIYCFSL